MRIAAIQLNSKRNIDANLATTASYLAEAAAAGTDIVVLPENFAFMGGSESEKRLVAGHDQSQSIISFLAASALKHKLSIIAGSLLLEGRQGRLHNALLVFDRSGKQVARYDKMHLFDMDYGGEHYAESALIEAGTAPGIVELEGSRVGLSICYDLRFPELYRHYSHAGCSLLCNVAAFTEVTGKAHWEVLLRARAIENQCYMVAAAQWGEHADGRHTWGHSMIIDPWGEIVAELPSGEGVVWADVSESKLQELRQSMPVLRHRRLP